MNTPPDGVSPPAVDELRQRWQPTFDHLVEAGKCEPTRIRIHRSLSWLQRIESMGDGAASDDILLYRWIALNSLYGRWDEVQREPEPDWASVRRFAERVRELDRDDRLGAMLETHRGLVMAIFEDEYLTKFFWEEPTEARARKTKKTKFDARTWYHEKRYGPILERLLQRLYFLRCQLVHGAATHGGRLNRTALDRCGKMLGHVVPAVLLVIIDNGYEEDWGALCYPPMWPLDSKWNAGGGASVTDT